MRVHRNALKKKKNYQVRVHRNALNPPNTRKVHAVTPSRWI